MITLRCRWHPRLNLSGCRKLKILDLSGYKPRSRDLSELPSLPSLLTLSLVQAPITSLDGIADTQA